MKRDKKPIVKDELWIRAERCIAIGEISEDVASDFAKDLVHELRVHQVELEMQNEELRRAQAEIEESRARYADLYDFAPVGYLTLDERGLVMEANLTLAKQLGIERTHLITIESVPGKGTTVRVVWCLPEGDNDWQEGLG